MLASKGRLIVLLTINSGNMGRYLGASTPISSGAWFMEGQVWMHLNGCRLYSHWVYACLLRYPFYAACP